jgi:ubiquinone/menaquinone biosynthesis C-methylase UbiE
MTSPLQKDITSDRIQDTLYAFTRSQILFTAIDLDLFSHIAQGCNRLDALVERLGVSERGLRMLLNGLVGIGFLQVELDNGYTLPPDAAHFLVKENDTYLGGMVHHCKRLYENWSLLTEAVDSGQPVGGAQSLAQLEAYFSELVKGLYVSNYPTARKLADALGCGKAHHGLSVLDVAGGSAVWSIAMLEKDPESRATVMDFPSVIHVAEEYVAHHGLSACYSYLPGDLEEIVLPPSQFDLAVLANICHTLGPVATEKTILKLAETIKPGGRLAIVDFVPDDLRSQPGWPMIFGVNMLITSPEGDVFTAGEYRQWLHSAGFSRVTFQEIDKEVTAIIAEL